MLNLTLLDGTARHRVLRPLGLDWPTPSQPLAEEQDLLAIAVSPVRALLFSRYRDPCDRLLRALAPGIDASAVAVDVGESTRVLRCANASGRAAIARLIDADSRPTIGGSAAVRLIDIPAVVMSFSTGALWLSFDRPLEDYVREWLQYATESADLPL